MKILNVFLTVAALVGCAGQAVYGMGNKDMDLWKKYNQGVPDIIRVQYDPRVDASVTLNLLRKGAKVNAVDQYGNTALYYVIDKNPSNMPEKVRLLMASGANPDIKNKQGKSARDLVTGNENLRHIARILDSPYGE